MEIKPEKKITLREFHARWKMSLEDKFLVGKIL